MVDGTVAISRGSVLADVLDAPVAELTMRDYVDAGKNLVDAGALGNMVSCLTTIGVMDTYLVLLKAILEDVLDNQAAGLAESDFVPHSSKSLVDITHDLWGRVAPAELKELLPDMTRVAVDHGLGDTTKQLMNHRCLVLFGNSIKGLQIGRAHV